jgi:membrane-bound lytic murein transglycosylase B
MPTAIRPCEECGEPFEAKTKRAKFCGATCRVRANRRPSKTGAAKAAAGGTVTHLPIAGGPLDQTSPADPSVEDIVGSLAEQVRKTLTEAKALDTIAGAQAVRIARQIDRGDDSGSAVATLSKELSRLVAEAKVEAAPRIRDAADDVMERVAQKLSLVAQ